MARKGCELRPLARLRSTTGAAYPYVTGKNRRHDPDRICLLKGDPGVRRHVEPKEGW